MYVEILNFQIPSTIGFIIFPVIAFFSILIVGLGLVLVIISFIVKNLNIIKSLISFYKIIILLIYLCSNLITINIILPSNKMLGSYSIVTATTVFALFYLLYFLPLLVINFFINIRTRNERG